MRGAPRVGGMSAGMGPGSPGPISMKSGEGATSGLPKPPQGSTGPLRWFSIGVVCGVVATLIVVGIIIAIVR